MKKNTLNSTISYYHGHGSSGIGLVESILETEHFLAAINKIYVNITLTYTVVEKQGISSVVQKLTVTLNDLGIIMCRTGGIATFARNWMWAL